MRLGEYAKKVCTPRGPWRASADDPWSKWPASRIRHGSATCTVSPRGMRRKIFDQRIIGVAHGILRHRWPPLQGQAAPVSDLKNFC